MLKIVFTGWECDDNSIKQTVTFNYSPLNIADILNKHLFSGTLPIILTSATLSVANNLNFYRKRVGFSGRELILDSPFDYTRQAKISYNKRNAGAN